MRFNTFSKNGQILPQEQATIPLANIAYQYGFGVYETLKVRNNILYFVDQHIDRLITSAELLGLTHFFSKSDIIKYIQNLIDDLVNTNETPTFSCNLKMLLIGATRNEDVQLFIIPLDPLYPDRKFYKRGVKTITTQYERVFPNVKSLNMLMSFLSYKKASENGCYDGLFVDHNNTILEGTRTNFYVIKDKTIITPGEKYILQGVTRQTVLHVAKKNGYTINEDFIPLKNILDNQYDGAFLTSTSSKIVPINQIDEFQFETITENIYELIRQYDAFLEESHGIFKDSV